MAENRSGRKQRKLRNIFINTSFQAKIILLIAGIVLMQAVLTTGYFCSTFDQFFQTPIALVDINSEFIEAAEDLKLQIFVGFMIANAGFLIFALLIGIYFSHKLAGPNYAIKRAITSLLDGVDQHKIYLRKGDEFHDLAERINQLFTDYHLVKREKESESEE